MNLAMINDVSVCLGHGNGSFASETRYSVGSYPLSVAVGDFNNDAHLDIVIANSESNDVSVLLCHGNGSFASQTRYLAGATPISVAVGDFNKDTGLDIVVANRDSNDVSVLLGHGNGFFANETRYSVGYGPQSVATGDLNSDTLLDIVVVNGNENDVSVLLQYNRGALTYNVAYAAGGGSSIQCIVIDDFNSDTNLDIILSNQGTNNLGVLFGYGNGSFEKEMMLSTGSKSRPVLDALGDFNGDNLVDIAIANYGTKEVVMMLGNENGTFEMQKSHGKSFDSRPLAMISGDLDNDKRSEIAIVYDDNDN
ncbi:unnamed protein product, partial [Rotaria sordida]